MNNDFDHIDLIKKAQKGDQAALNELSGIAAGFLRPYLYRLTMNRQLSEDVVQETLIQMVSSLDGLKEPESYWSWLRKIANSKYYRMIRKQKKHNHTSLEGVDCLDKSFDSVADTITAEWKDIVRASLVELDPKYRQVITLRCYEKMSYADIAEEMETSNISARMMFYRAKKVLGKKLSKKGMSRTALTAAIVMFGQLTGPDAASAGAMGISGGLLKVGGAASVAAVITGKTFVSIFVAVSVLTAAAILPMKSKMRSSQRGFEAGNNFPVQNAGSDGAFNSEMQGWYYYPEKGEDAVMTRLTKNGKPFVLQNGGANYHFCGGRVKIKNYNHYNSDYSVKVLPGDDLTVLKYFEHNSGLNFDDFEGVINGQSGLLVKVSFEDEHFHTTGFKHLNALEEGYFKCDWAAGTSVLDKRDRMHQRGWTYFELKGDLGGEPIRGKGEIPFVYLRHREHRQWMEIRKAGKIWYMRDFVGFSRPWQGLHSIDVIRRDAIKNGSEFRTAVSKDGKIGYVTIKEGQTDVIYNIDMGADLVKEIVFEGEVSGRIDVNYFDDVSALDREFGNVYENLKSREKFAQPLWKLGDR